MDILINVIVAVVAFVAGGVCYRNYAERFYSDLRIAKNLLEAENARLTSKIKELFHE